MMLLLYVTLMVKENMRLKYDSDIYCTKILTLPSDQLKRMTNKSKGPHLL